MGLRIVDNLSARLEGLSQKIKPSRVAKVVAVRLVQLVKGNFYKLNTERHQADTVTGYYAEAAKNTQFTVDGSKIDIAVNQIGIRQRYYGGEIVAGAGGTGKKFLSIPARTETMGRSALEFDNLVVLYGHMSEGGIGPVALVLAPQALVTKDQSKKGPIKKSEQRTPKEDRPTLGGEVMFWLKEKVQQMADRSVLPSDDEFLVEMQGAVKTFLDSSET